MEGYSVRIMPSAQVDALDIVDYLNSLSPDLAQQYFDMLVEKISVLSKSPEEYSQARDTQLRIRGYRTMLVKDYIVFFTITGKKVEIRRILYGKRQYSQLC